MKQVILETVLSSESLGSVLKKPNPTELTNNTKPK